MNHCVEETRRTLPDFSIFSLDERVPRRYIAQTLLLYFSFHQFTSQVLWQREITIIFFKIKINNINVL